MANKTWKDMGFRIASSTSVLTDISAFVNNQSLQSAITDLMTTGMGATANTRLNGLANISVPVNGFWNTTTRTVFARAINGTTVPMRVEFKTYSGGYFNGSVLPTSIQVSGQPDTLELFSVTLNFTKAMNSTSVALT
jgi:hypothetical protein